MAYHELVEKQREYFNSNVTRSLSGRRDRLRSLRRMITENGDMLCAAVDRDLRRDPAVTIAVEISGAITEIDYFLENLDEWSTPEKVSKTFLTALDTPLICKDPLGVVLIISPWNYPVCLLLLPMIPAIAAGNTLVLKPSEISSNVAKAFEELIPRYFDEEAIAVVNGGVAETTELLQERFDHILYTGNPVVGRVVMAAAAKHLTPVTLELGGKCPVVVEDDANLEISVRRIAWGKWLNLGQTCLAPDYVMVTEKTRDRFVEVLERVLEEFYGDDVKSSKDYSRIISERQFDRLVGVLGRSRGDRVIGKGEPDRVDLFIPPTVVLVERDDALLEEEIFGPILPIVTVAGLTDAIDVINQGEKPLAAYIFTKSNAKVRRFLTETSSGAVTVNDVIMHMTVDTLPFGGVGNSGMGRYRGKFGFDTFTHEKAVLHRGYFGESLMAVRYPPTTPEKSRSMQRLTGTRIALPPRWLSRAGCVLPLVTVSFLAGLICQKYVF